MCKPKPNISLLEVHAKNMGGTLLSVNYIDAKTEEQFLSQQRRDKEKNQYCKDRGILLIVIPYTVKDLDTYINNLCVSN